MPMAGSQISSLGCGFTKRTIMSRICFGVRNWPLVPAVDSLLSMYSYKSPKSPMCSSKSRMRLSMPLTAFCSVRGF